MSNSADYFIDAKKGFDVDSLADEIKVRTCRTDFNAPGFALVRLPNSTSSLMQRTLMVSLKERLSNRLFEERGTRLGWFNITRFDQKVTTKPHRDGAPAESLLILGYEQTQIRSQLSIADYSKCAYEMGITPDQFLEEYNPMYQKGLELIKPYTTQLMRFDISAFQILIVNNSSNPYISDQKWQGVLHSATVLDAAAPKPRIINSTCVYPLALGEISAVPQDHQDFFLADSELAPYKN